MSRPPGIRDETRFDEPIGTITREQYRRMNGGPVAIVPDLIQPPRPNGPAAACEQCGGPFTRKRDDQRFCSAGCGGKWHSQHRPPKAAKTKRPVVALPDATCEQCGEEFARNRKTQRFCCQRCSALFNAPRAERPPSAKTPPQPTLVAVPELPTEPAPPLELPAAAALRVLLAALAVQAIGAADAWHLEAWLGPGTTLTLRKEAT